MKKVIRYIVVFSMIIIIAASSLFVSAIVSGDSELTILENSTAYVPGNTSSEVTGLVSNLDDYSRIGFQMKYTGVYEVNLKFNFSSSHIYGRLRLLIKSNDQGFLSNLVSNTKYQGVYVGGKLQSSSSGWHYGHVDAYTVEIIYEGNIPSNFNVVSYYNVSNELTGYVVATYEFQPIDKGTQEIINNQNANANAIQQNQDKNASDIQANQDKNTDKLLDAGSDVPQPDFDSTNGQIDNTVGQMQSIEGQFQIDKDSTQAALDEGNSFWQGSDMQRASVQVKNWIERFADDNTSMSGFFVAAMVLGLCFWIIGRKAGSG